MGMGSLATVALQQPANLVIVVLDNERYGETGMQATHTAGKTDLAAIAEASGISRYSPVFSWHPEPAKVVMSLTNENVAIVIKILIGFPWIPLRFFATMPTIFVGFLPQSKTGDTIPFLIIMSSYFKSHIGALSFLS